MQDRVGTLAEECCCIQLLSAEQNQAFLMEVFIFRSAVWPVLASICQCHCRDAPPVVALEDNGPCGLANLRPRL